MASDAPPDPHSKGLKLFGVRIMGDASDDRREDEEMMRKSRSMGSLASAAEHGAGDQGYLSDGGLVGSSRRRHTIERKRGIPWTEEEHRTFLAGLHKLGKGDWRGISKNFVITRTPTQVASHAQKYFLRQSNPNKKRRRSSLFDVVMDEMATINATSSQPSSKKSSEVREENVQPFHNKPLAGISGTSKDQVVPTLPLAPALLNPDQANRTYQANFTLFAPSLLFLSTNLPPQPQPHLLAQPADPAPSLNNDDLELSIAPPQQHNLSSLPSQGAPGVIRVV